MTLSLVMLACGFAYAAAGEPAKPTAIATPFTDLLAAAGLLLLAGGLVVAELLVVSMGMLAVLACVAAFAGIWLAFGVHPVAGWISLVVAPMIGTVAFRLGLDRMRRSSLVPQAEITADAGYQHTLDLLGIHVGAEGELVTDAYPSGRARFTTAKGAVEADVQVGGGSLKRGARIRVTAIDGATAQVIAVTATAASLSSDASTTSPSPVQPTTSTSGS